MKKVLDFIIKHKVMIGMIITALIDVNYGILDHYFTPTAANLIRLIGTVIFGYNYTSPYNKKVIVEKFLEEMKTKK